MGESTSGRSSRQASTWSAIGVGIAVVVAYLPGSGRALDLDSAQTVGSYVRTPSVFDAIRSQRLFNNHPAFSLIEHVVYSVSGSSEEWVLRLAPIAFAGCAAALLVAAVGRYVGLLGAFCAGLVFATNPTVIELSRAVRGYSLLLLCSIASTAALATLLSSHADGIFRKRPGVVYAVAVAVGVATHLYMLLVVLGHLAVVAARRDLDRSWARRWLIGVGIGASVYVAMIPELVDAVSAGSRTFKPVFPLRLAEVVVGAGLGGLLIGSVALMGAVGVLRDRVDLRAASAAVGGAIAVSWLVTASVHLEPRFHVWLVPAAAALTAAAVTRRRLLVGGVVAGCILNTIAVLPGYRRDPNAQPALAVVLEHVAARGQRGCVTSYSALPMLGYTSAFDPVVHPDQLAACDVVVVPFPNLDGDLANAARQEMTVTALFTAETMDGLAMARDPSFFDALCRRADLRCATTLSGPSLAD